MKTLFGKSNISFNDKGTGCVVVLLHGFSESQKIWDNFADKLSGKYRIVMIDLPGHGESDCIGEVHTMEMIADSVKHVLDLINVKECVIVGHSMGGYAGLTFTEKYPGITKGLCLFHSTAYADSPETKLNRERTIEIIKSDHYDFFLNFIPDLFAPSNRDLYYEKIVELIDESKKISKQAIIASLEGMKIREDKTNVLQQTDIPFLFIAGKQDIRIPYQKVLEQAGIPKDSVAVIIDGIGHMGYIEAEEKTLHALKCFIGGIYS